jgi:MFS family permease
MDNRDAIEAMSFKATAGGLFVFRAPKPWLFGKTSNYLADEAQKAEILTAMTRNVSAGRRAVVIGALLLGCVLWAIAVSLLMWAISSHEEPTARELVIMSLLIAGPVIAALYLGLALSVKATLAKIAPLIARLQPTDEQITRADLRRGIMKSTSLRAMVLINLLFGASALIWALVLGMRMANHRLVAAPTALVLFDLVMSLVVIGIYSTMALRKASEGQKNV